MEASAANDQEGRLEEAFQAVDRQREKRLATEIGNTQRLVTTQAGNRTPGPLRRILNEQARISTNQQQPSKATVISQRHAIGARRPRSLPFDQKGANKRS
jgi:hypothetical protein